MNDNEFRIQLDRLRQVYGDRSYPEDRARLLWKAVAAFSGSWLARTVDSMIGSLRQAPMLSDFQEAITQERERNWAQERQQQGASSYKEWVSMFTNEEEKMFAQMIIKRLEHKVDDITWEGFMRHLDDLAKLEKKK